MVTSVCNAEQAGQSAPPPTVGAGQQPVIVGQQPGGARKLYSLKKLARGSGSCVLRMIILAIIGFFLMPFTLHRLGDVEYGIWAVALAFIGYYSFLDLGLSGAVFTHMAYALAREDHEEARNIYGSSLIAFGVVGIVLLMVTLALSGGIFILNRSPHGRLLAIVLLIIGINTAVTFFMRVPFGVLNSALNFDITAWVLILSAIVRAVGTVILLETHHSVISLAWLSVLVPIPANIIVLRCVHRKFPFLRIFSRPRWNRATARTLFTFGGPVILGGIADKIRFQADVLTVSFFIGLTAVAHYSIGTTLVMYFMDGVAAVIGVLMPVLSMQKSVNDDAGFRHSYFSGTRVALSCAAFIAFGMIAWSRAFLIPWMGPRFVDVYPVIVLLTIAVLIETSQSTSVNALYASLHQKAYAAINISEAIANLILSILLARPYGMVGVAVGTLIPSIVFRLIVQPIVVEKCLHISARDTAAVFLRTGARCAACLVLPLLISRLLLAPDYPHLVAVAALSTVAYALPVWWFEFGGIGADRIASPLRTMRRALLAR